MQIKSALVFLLLASVPTGAWAERKPLSAIDWLSQSVKTPTKKGAVAEPPPQPTEPVAKPAVNNGSKANLPPVANEPKVTTNALPVAVATTVLGGASLDAVGLLPSSVTGFPRNLWGIGKNFDIATAISQTGPGDLPALQSLLITLLLAEADAPVDSVGGGAIC